MGKSNWIAYHSKATSDIQHVHYVFLIDTESLEFTGFCHTCTPNLEVIINMIKDSLANHPTPSAIYVTEGYG